jgi:DNA-binding LacI/PurR family transcriptional regulator
LAFGAIDELHRLGLEVPGDVSVVGFDDVLEAVEIYPALTTVRQPVKEMAKVAFKEAMALLDEESIEQYEAVHLVPDLVVRETTAAINLKK